MKIKAFLPLLLLGFVASAPVPNAAVPVTDTDVQGDYVEARTASVFCGACHYNGELVVDGRSVIMAWNITHGQWNGTDLTGVRAMAEVACDANLSDPQANRTCQVVIDNSATNAQSTAMIDLIQHTGGLALGKMLPAHRVAISFKHDGGEYNIAAAGFGDMIVDALPNNECCTQPHLVWYTPIVPLTHRKVGYTQQADYTSNGNGETWERSDENSAFYGSIAVAAK